VEADGPLSAETVLETEYRTLLPNQRFEGGGVETLRRTLHHESPPLAALCLSGGGIRSATFALGVLQGLARRRLLAGFDYLSTVSGGGYIGSWLTAWKHRQRESGGLAAVMAALQHEQAPAPAGEPDPVQHLREYNSYLSPRNGVLSSDFWTLAATVFRNILLNWLVLVPLLMFVLMVPRLFLSALAFPEWRFGDIVFAGAAGRHACGPQGTLDYCHEALDVISGSPFVNPGLPLLSALLFGAALFFTLRCLPGVGHRAHTRFDYVRWCLAPLVGAGLAFIAFDSLFYLGTHYTSRSSLGPVLGSTLVAAGAAWVLALPFGTRRLRDRMRLSLAVFAMAAGTAIALWVAVNVVLVGEDPDAGLSWAAYVTLGLPVVLLGFCLGTVLFVGLSSRFLEDEDREWMSRAVAGVLLVALAWGACCAAVLMLPEWALDWNAWGHGALAAVASGSAWLAASGGSPVARANPGSASFSVLPRLVPAAVRAAPAVFLVLFAGALSVLTNVILLGLHRATDMPLTDPAGQAVAWHDHYGVLARSHPALLVLLAAALLLIAQVMARYININTFSLHAMYRDRLVRAYLGASNPARAVSEFTGFARNDDLPMADLQGDPPPLHVVNLTLNLVATSRLAWQERKAESFTVTPLHCGSRQLGYRPADGYGGGLTLGTAVALSGAAASPNMGYHSSPIVGFIMTLFNARLGAWLGNPGPAGADTWRLPGPRSATRSLVNEALGQTSDRSEFVYLSDGGHFENLGLYEMVWRRCRLLVVIDGGCDPGSTLDDLGNALRKIRIDLGVPICFDDGHVAAVRRRERRYAIAAVQYSAVDGPCADGRLVYIKPMLLGTEPPDVGSYAASHADFPHESTADQWFHESQTESYRQLGLTTIDEMCLGWSGGPLAGFFEHLETASRGTPSAAAPPSAAAGWV
jgi:hypothetical protein